MSTKVASSINVVFEDDDNQESLLYSGETTLSPSKFAIKFIVVFREEPPLSWSNWNLKYWFFVEGGKPESLEKNPQSKARTNLKLNPSMALDWNQAWATLVGGKRSHHCAIPTSPN